jgi:hypothetical protein
VQSGVELRVVVDLRGLARAPLARGLPRLGARVRARRVSGAEFSEAQRGAEYVYGEEIELGVESTLDVLGLAETVLLA